MSQLFSEWSGRSISGKGLDTGGTQLDRRHCPTLALLYRVWDRGKSLLGISGFTKLFPLWDNLAFLPLGVFNSVVLPTSVTYILCV